MCFFLKDYIPGIDIHFLMVYNSDVEEMRISQYNIFRSKKDTESATITHERTAEFVKARTLFICLLSTILLFFFLSGKASAASTGDTQSLQPYVFGSDFTVVQFDIEGSQYSSLLWPTLGAAVSHYGTDYTYSSCSRYFGGLFFNYNYGFSDGTKQYFRVSE